MSRDWNIVDDEEPPTPAEPSDALDGRRIHAIVLERRATHRARLRAVLVPIACAAVALSAVAQAWSMRAAHGGRATAGCAIAAAAVWLGVRAARRRRPPAANVVSPAAMPDFTSMAAAPTHAERLAALERLGR